MKHLLLHLPLKTCSCHMCSSWLIVRLTKGWQVTIIEIKCKLAIMLFCTPMKYQAKPDNMVQPFIRLSLFVICHVSEIHSLQVLSWVLPTSSSAVERDLRTTYTSRS